MLPAFSGKIPQVLHMLIQNLKSLGEIAVVVHNASIECIHELGYLKDSTLTTARNIDDGQQKTIQIDDF